MNTGTAHSHSLLGYTLCSSGIAQGFLLLDFAFDYNAVMYENTSRLEHTFAYYNVILNNPFVALTTALVIICVHVCTYILWKKYSSVKTGAALSSIFRAAFFKYLMLAAIYLLIVLPRYLPFMGNASLVFSKELLTGWSTVLFSRLALLVGNFHTMSTLVNAGMLLAPVLKE